MGRAAFARSHARYPPAAPAAESAPAIGSTSASRRQVPAQVSAPRADLAGGLLRLFAFRLVFLHSRGEVFSHDLFDLVHDHHVKTRRFLDSGVRQTGIGGQIDVGQLTLEVRSRGHWLAEAILLIKIHQVEYILGYRLRPRRIESDDQFDRNILAVELVGDIERGVCAERMTDDDNDVLVPA